LRSSFLPPRSTVRPGGSLRGGLRDARVDRWCALATACIAAALSGVLAVVLLPHLSAAPTAADPADGPLARDGAAIYQSACAGCHGTDLRARHKGAIAGVATAPPLDAGGHSWLHSDAALFRIVKYGVVCADDPARTAMPAFDEQLDDHAIRSVLAFVKRRWPQPVRDVQSVMSADSVGAGPAFCTSQCRPAANVSPRPAGPTVGQAAASTLR